MQSWDPTPEFSREQEFCLQFTVFVLQMAIPDGAVSTDRPLSGIGGI